MSVIIFTVYLILLAYLRQRVKWAEHVTRMREIMNSYRSEFLDQRRPCTKEFDFIIKYVTSGKFIV
jgi:aspartate/tyrosine/aromatic aminotransferase